MKRPRKTTLRGRGGGYVSDKKRMAEIITFGRFDLVERVSRGEITTAQAWNLFRDDQERKRR